jgi:hypothetical protein
VQRKKTFLVVCISILTSPVWAQVAPVGVLKNSGLVVGLPRTDTVSLLHSPLVRPTVVPDWRAYGSGSYLGGLGFFCKKELDIEKATHLPIRFRLGSLQEVNRLEGKPGW